MTGAPLMSLPRARGSLAVLVRHSGLSRSSGEEDGLARLVGDFDADDVAAGDCGDADGGDGEGAGDVVGEADDAGAADAGGGLEFVEGDDRAGADLADGALDAVIAQDALEEAGVGLGGRLRWGRWRISEGPG